MAFEREIAAYHARLPELLQGGNEGRYVLIRGDAVSPVTYASYDDALAAGYEGFGLESFFVRKVQRDDPIARFSRGLG